MAKSKFVKLGEKASVFFDPTSKLKITPNQAVELSNESRMSKRVIAALKSGHIEYAYQGDEDDQLQQITQDSLSKGKKDQKVARKSKTDDKPKDSDPVNDDEGEDDEWDEKSLMRLKKQELINMAKENGSEFTEEELEDSNKEELTEEILSLLEEDPE